jgi:hypothetical protein
VNQQGSKKVYIDVYFVDPYIVNQRVLICNSDLNNFIKKQKELDKEAKESLYNNLWNLYG